MPFPIAFAASMPGPTIISASRSLSRSCWPASALWPAQALLVFFLRHPDEVLSRTRIYEQVWDERYDGLSNTLEVHVMELRRKLEAHGPRLIHTLRHRGYLFGDAPGSLGSPTKGGS